MSNTIRDKFVQLEALKEAATDENKELIEAIILQTSILNERLASIEMNIGASLRR